MDIRWFKGIPDEVSEDDREKQVLGYRNAFDALREVLQREVQEFAPDYDIASWANKQADVNGANRMLRSILKLIDTQPKG